MVVMAPRAPKEAKKSQTTEVNGENNILPDDGTVNKVFLVTQELKFVKTLAGNDPKLRAKVLKNLQTWLTTRSRSSFAFTDADFLRIWKGLFYCMWMSDKPLVQESLSEELGSLINCFDDLNIGIQFFGRFLETMCLEWFGIDQWRIDKFMMLVRRVTRKMIMALHENEWKADMLENLMKQIEETILDSKKCPAGLSMHFNELFLEEVAKVTDGQVEKEVMHKIIETYVTYYMKTTDIRLLKHTQRVIFYHLMFQSDLGQMYQEKFDLWKRANFPTTNIDDVEFKIKYTKKPHKGDEEEEDDDEDEDSERVPEKVYDPRAGRVNVVINEIQFDALEIISMFDKIRYKPFISSLGRKHMKNLVKKLKQFSTGSFPIGTQVAHSKYSLLPEGEEPHFDVDAATEEMLEFENEAFKRSERGDKKKKKKKDQSMNPYPKFVDTNTDKEPSTWNEQENGIVEEENNENVKNKKRKAVAERKEGKVKKAKIENAVPEKQLKRKSLPNLKLSEPAEKEIKEKIEVVEKKSKSAFEVKDEWSEPLKEGETEQFIPSRKLRLKEINSAVEEKTTEVPKKLLKNPFSTPKNSLKGKKKSLSSPAQIATPTSAGKRVKIMLNKNISQEQIEYIKQVRNSPKVPFDSTKKPSKGLLKPNLMPSPINPFYKKKIGLKLKLNDTM